jgi:Domain of unknown function (DUF3899)
VHIFSKKMVSAFLICQGFIFLLSFIFYKKITLLYYINISFYLSGTMVFLSLLFYTIHSGFFDTVFHSFRTLFTKEEKSEEQSKADKPQLSELINLNISPFAQLGVVNLLFMLGSLILFYL